MLAALHWNARAISAPSSPAPQAAFKRTLEPKKPGRWIVDAAQALDSDTNKLSEALANAAAGETVYLRAGVYRESVVVSRDVSLVGLGALKDIVVESDAAGPTLAVEGARFSIKNVTLSHAGARLGKALESRRAQVELKASALKAAAQDEGIDAIGGTLALSYSTVEGGSRGVDAHDGAKVTIDHATISKADAGVYLQGATAQISDSSFLESRKGLTVAEQAQASVLNGYFIKDAVGVWADRGGQVKLSNVGFPQYATAVLADERGRAEVKDCSFSDGSGAALAAEAAGEILDRGSTILRGQNAARAKGKGTLALVDTQIEEMKGDAIIVIEGSAALSGVKIARGAGNGLSLQDPQAVRVEKSAISGNGGAALFFAGSAQKLTLDVEGSTLTGNNQGPVAGDTARVAIRGKNNDPRNLQSLIQ